jgi:uracil-DNA glycosylase
VGPLNDLTRRWRKQDIARRIPWFDPDGGDTNARVLVLMEAPGPRTVRDGDSGFCSEDNDDATAATLHELRHRSGLPRGAYVRWNIVPWAVYAPDGHWRAPTDQDLLQASPALGELLAALPQLRLVICMGAKALTGFMRHITLTDNPTPPVILGVPHPSQRNTRARTEALTRIENALRVGAAVALE